MIDYLEEMTKGEMDDVMTIKRTILGGLSIASLVLASGLTWAAGRYGPGVSDTGIKIGNTMPYSGPASAYGVIGKSETAYFAMVNDQGGVNGRRINFKSRDDGYSLPRTAEMVRRVVEEDKVLLLFNTRRRQVERPQAPSLDDGPSAPAIAWRRASMGTTSSKVCPSLRSQCSTRTTILATTT